MSTIPLQAAPVLRMDMAHAEAMAAAPFPTRTAQGQSGGYSGPSGGTTAGFTWCRPVVAAVLRTATQEEGRPLRLMSTRSRHNRYARRRSWACSGAARDRFADVAAVYRRMGRGERSFATPQRASGSCNLSGRDDETIDVPMAVETQ